MDLVKENYHRDSGEDASPYPSVSPENSGMSGIFGDPEVLPRVGDEYQVEIPPQVTKSNYIPLFSENPSGERVNSYNLIDFCIGLPIPVMWINEEAEIVKYNQESNKNESPTMMETRVGLEGQENEIMLSKLTNFVLQEEIKMEMDLTSNGKGFCPVPGCLSGSWCDMEEESFLLGLYIFGKNLVRVKKFVGTKETGDILSFYYGKFFGSEKYRRWSECRKMRGRRCVCGQRLFTGWRQQELLSRLLPNLSEESQNGLMEVAKTFGDGKMELEEYVYFLKATAGLKAFVEAVAIGKGKKDLTKMTTEPLKFNQVVPIRPEIPIGKACSTLTPLEIINFLTGDFRLSKARSSDLFWEAVWPRLLARGWHSEQPNDHNYAAGSKNSLVFLIPGIKKFSRRKLIKGSHYYDSVSDVLNKVVSEPGLLELENNGSDKDYSNKEENGWTEKIKPDRESFANSHRHCYLKPRTPNRNTNTNMMKCTIVDTSLADGKDSKVRELKSLPIEISSASKSHSEENDMDSSEESTDESDSDYTVGYDKEETKISKPTWMNLDQRVSLADDSCLKHPTDVPDSTISSSELAKNESTGTFQDTQPSKVLLCQLSEKTGLDNNNHLADVSKRIRRLNGRDCPEISFYADHTGFNEHFLSQADSSQEKSFSSSLSIGSPITICNGMPKSTRIVSEHPNEENQPHTLINLNLPVLTNNKSFQPSTSERKEKKHNGTNKNAKASKCVSISEQQPIMISRRQSNRNRPPTTKALEALALGLLDVKQKRRSKDAFSEEYSTFKTSQRARAKVRHNEDFVNDIVDSKIEERENSSCNNGNGDVFHKLEV